MESTRQNTLTSSGIIFLLLVQVILSALIIKRLNDNDQNLSNMNQRISLVIGPQQPDIPAYVEGVAVDDDPWRGIKNAPVTIVEFSDFECPFCLEASQNIDAILDEYEGKVLFVYRDFPLEQLHPHALKAAEAANCAGEQGKYWEMHDLLLENQAHLEIDDLKMYASQLELNQEAFTVCLEGNYADEIAHDMQDGNEYQVRSTPTFFVNGQRVEGASPAQLRVAIENALRKEKD